jgi:hypothetical protein
MSLINMTPPSDGSSAEPVTLEQVQSAVPAHMKSTITQGFVDQINSIVTDPIFAADVRNNFVSYAGVMKDGRHKLEDYLHAVVYVSYKIMGETNQDAYAKTFPGRYLKMKQDGRSSKDISAYVSAYNKGKLVNAILEQTMVPTWVLNQHLFQKAINVQATIMVDEDVSAKVRVEAANSLLTHLKKPEVKEFQISMENKDSSGITELKDALRDLAQTQRQAIESGAKVGDIAGSTLINVTPTPGKSEDTDNGLA